MQDFRLGSSTASMSQLKEAKKEGGITSVNKSLLSIDYASKYVLLVTCNTHLSSLVENNELTDYMKEGDVGFKKLKVCSNIMA